MRLIRIRPANVLGHANLAMAIPIGVSPGEAARVVSVIATVLTDATVGVRNYVLSMVETTPAAVPAYQVRQSQDIGPSSTISVGFDENSNLQPAGVTVSPGAQKAPMPFHVFDRDFTINMTSTGPGAADSTLNVEVLVRVGKMEEILT